MAVNVERFKSDLKRLIDQGNKLQAAMVKELFGNDVIKKQLKPKLDDKAAEKFVNDLPDFKSAYQAWYSESIILIRQLVPDRLSDFKWLYEKPKTRKDITFNNYIIQDYMQGLTVRSYGKIIVEPFAALPQYEQQLNILKAAERRFESSLFEIRQLVQADLFDAEIDAARELLRNKFLRAAGAVAGVILEKHLKQVCDDHSIKIKKSKPTLSVLNDALREADVIDVPQWRFNQHLADIRNLCDHHKAQAPSEDQVRDLIDGTAKVLKTIA